jgi:hypothetical protein
MAVAASCCGGGDSRLNQKNLLITLSGDTKKSGTGEDIGRQPNSVYKEPKK